MEDDRLPVLGDVHVSRPVDRLARVRLGQRLPVLELPVWRRAPYILDVVLVGAVAVRAEEQDLLCSCEVSDRH